MGNATEVTVLHAILDHALDRCGNRAPGAAKQLGDRVPGQQFGPFGRKTTIGAGQSLPPVTLATFRWSRASMPTTTAPSKTVRRVEPATDPDAPTWS